MATRLGLPNVRGHHAAFVIALLVDSLGTGLFLPFSLLYFHLVAELPLPAVGAALTVATFATLPMTPVTGALVDRFGSRRLVIASQVLQAIGFLGYLAVHSIPVLLVTAVFVTGGGRVFYAASAALIAEVSGPGERDRWYGFVRATQNVGLGAGGLLAGVVVAIDGAHGFVGYRLLIQANVLSFLLTAALLRWYMREPQQPRGGMSREPGYRAVLADRPFLGLVACNVVFALCALLLVTGLPIYAIESLGISTAIVGTLFALNTLLIVGGQTVIMRVLEHYRRTRILAVAGLVWVVACALFAMAPALPNSLVVPFLVGAVGVYTLAALVHTPTATALAAAVAIAPLRGRYIAAYELSWGIAAALAPVVFTGLYAVGSAWPWLTVGGLALIASMSVVLLESRLPAHAIRPPRFTSETYSIRRAKP
jgi:MFS family permease